MQAAKFLQKYGQMELFPVKLQVPLLMTVYLLLLNKCGEDCVDVVDTCLSDQDRHGSSPISRSCTAPIVRLTSLSCREFRLLKPDDEAMQDSFYELPKDFKLKSIKGTGFGGPPDADVALL